MSIYERTSAAPGKSSRGKELYQLLDTGKYRNRPYESSSLGEGMAVINETIRGWWKPRFLLDHDERRAYEFMDGNERLVAVSKDDIDWESLEGLPDEARARAEALSFHFPSFILGFRNGVAEVSWQLNPDGRYYMDDDGFGMTGDKEVTIYGCINRQAEVVAKFRAVKNAEEREAMRKQAEEKAKASCGNEADKKTIY